MFQCFLICYSISPPSFYLLPLWSPIKPLDLLLPFRESMGQIRWRSVFILLHFRPAFLILCKRTSLHLTYQPSVISYLDVDKPTIWLDTTAVEFYGMDPAPTDVCAELFGIRAYSLFCGRWFSPALPFGYALLKNNSVRGPPAPTMDALDCSTAAVPPIILWSLALSFFAIWCSRFGARYQLDKFPCSVCQHCWHQSEYFLGRISNTIDKMDDVSFL